MPDVSFTSLLVVAAIAVLAPLTVGFFTRLRIPAVVLEIIGGIIVGPSVLGWVHIDLPVQILALFGLAFLLFLAGLEIDVHRLRGRTSSADNWDKAAARSVTVFYPGFAGA
jgi:Kef-type K+ transport system membrane component KefB